jgi:hypothetical protein
MQLFSNDITKEMLALYKNKEYKQVCSLGFNNFTKHQKDEKYISIYAFGCLHSDSIDRLAVPITSLKHSPEARANSSYFSIILMQKKLLYHALNDGYEISKLKLPTTEYVLSRVFDLYSKLNQDHNKKVYTFVDPQDKKRSYKLYLTHKGKVTKMIIEEFYDTITLQRHEYW